MPTVEFEFELEFLTPAFIGGADPTQKADFTLKPLKSAMRYWWRQFQDIRNRPALFEKESRIFGSTKRCSPISLRLISKDGISCLNGAYQPIGSGLSYLFYSLRGCGKTLGIKIREPIGF
jgi:CRISPR type III-B/RAMP module RAMP protein Cmr1